MPYTGTIPYTAQDFVPGQKALAQDITNISYALARLDQNAANAYCVLTKPLGTDNQTVAKGNGSAAITFKEISADPLGMRTDDTKITIPFDGIWMLTAFFNANGPSSAGGWFRFNGVAGDANNWGTNSTNGPNVTINITMPVSAGTYIEAVYYNKDPNNQNGVNATVQRGVFSASLIH